MHSLNILPASCCLQGLPKTVIASGLIARVGVLFHELAGFPLSSCELPTSTTCSDKGLLSTTIHCEVSSEHSGFLKPLFLLRSLFLWAEDALASYSYHT